jgi:hypothetical protein
MRLPTDEFAACIGIDWADAKHDICLQAAGSEKRECSTDVAILFRTHGNKDIIQRMRCVR